MCRTAPDVVACCIGGAHRRDAAGSSPRAGRGAAVIYDGGFAERGEDGRRRRTTIAGICREAGMALCGPNGMGVLNPVAAQHQLSLGAARSRAGSSAMSG